MDVGQLGKRGLIQGQPRLEPSRLQRIDRQHCQCVAGRRPGVVVAEQGVEPAPQSLQFCHKFLLPNVVQTQLCERLHLLESPSPPFRGGGVRDHQSGAARFSISPASVRYACAPLECWSNLSAGTPKLGASASRTLRGITVR